MSEYDFTLKFALPDSNADPEQFIGVLLEAGCDDALIGIGATGRISLDFTREARSALEAVSSAVVSVKKAIPDVKLIEATPDLVGLTDVADILGFSRQNMRKIMLKGGADFPPPSHEASKSVFWHLSSILSWLANVGQYKIDKSLLELAEINKTLNAIREWQNTDPEIEEQVRDLCA